MVDDGAKTASFDFDGRSVQVSFTRPYWKVRFGDQLGEGRRLDDALEAVLGRSNAVVKLSVDILQWGRIVTTQIPSAVRRCDHLCRCE